MKDIFEINLKMFDGDLNTQVTTNSALSPEMRTYYSNYLIDHAEPNLVHDQFGQKHPIPRNGGKTIQFRKFMPFTKATTPLKEGITPDGGSLTVTIVESTVAQYGYYVTISDILDLTAVDNTLVETTKLLGSQAGATLDTVTREVLSSGTAVMYSGNVDAREALDENCKLTVDDIYKAARFLKAQNAPKIDGSYVAIVHPDVAYDIMRDEEWIDVHKYSAASEIFEGEIGKIGGVRFVESTEAKIFEAAGMDGKSVYSTLVLGANAYGVTEITGGGLQHIVKQLGSGGTADPLNQRATAGWKAIKTAEILVQNYMVRIESASTFDGGEN